MNEKQAELISALLDGELDPYAQQRTVSELLDAGDGERQRFGRYGMIGDVMRGESAVLATTVSDRVSRALRDEPVVLAPPRRELPRWLRPVAGVAVAASVAAAAVVVAPQLMTQPEQVQPVQMKAGAIPVGIAPTLVAGGTATPGMPTVEISGRWQAIDPTLEDRLNRLVIEHQEFAGRSGINGPVPHIGLVSYDGR